MPQEVPPQPAYIRSSVEIEADIQRSREESTAEAAETEALQRRLRERLAAEQRRNEYRLTLAALYRAGGDFGLAGNLLVRWGWGTFRA